MARRIPTVLTEEEAAALVAAIPKKSATGLRNRGMVAGAMLGAGLRVGEVVALMPRDLELYTDKPLVRVRRGKGSKDRTIPIDEAACGPLRAWSEKRRDLDLNGHGPFFCALRTGGFGVTELNPVERGRGERGKRLSVRSVQETVKRLAAKAGISKPVTPHTLRHTYATRTLRKPGFTTRDVQELLGHANVSTTEVYTHVDEERLGDLVHGKAEPEQGDDVQKLAEALAALSAEQRKALADLLAGVKA